MDGKGTTLECVVTSQAGSLFANYFGKCYEVLSCELHLKLLLIMHACLKYSVCAHAVTCPWRSEDTLAKLILSFHLYRSLGINFRSPGLCSKTLSTHQRSLRPCQLQLLTLFRETSSWVTKRCLFRGT